MSQQVQISCGTYKTVITGASLAAFDIATADGAMRAWINEALVDAILKTLRPGDILAVERCDKTGRCDGLNGEAGFQEYHETGALKREMHYKDNRLNDGPNGEPAQQEYCRVGDLIRAYRWEDGKFIKELNRAEITAWQARAAQLEEQRIVKKMQRNCPGIKVLIPVPALR